MENNDFLGRGWAFPPAFIKGKQDTVLLSEGIENINECLNCLLSTHLGERVMDFDYGTELKVLMFQDVDAELASRIEDTIKTAILRYEPRISVEEVKIDMSQGHQGLIQVQVEYLIIQINDRANYVYPFYLTEGTNLNL